MSKLRDGGYTAGCGLPSPPPCLKKDGFFTFLYFLELLDTTLCCFLDEDDEKYEEEEAKEGEEGESPYEKDVKKQRDMSSKVLPKVNAWTVI